MNMKNWQKKKNLPRMIKNKRKQKIYITILYNDLLIDSDSIGLSKII